MPLEGGLYGQWRPGGVRLILRRLGMWTDPHSVVIISTDKHTHQYYRSRHSSGCLKVIQGDLLAALIPSRCQTKDQRNANN